MADISSLLRMQEELYNRLKKALVNFKKTGKDKLKKSYLVVRLEALEQLYSEFKNGHKELVSFISRADKATLEYFTKDCYDDFEEVYTDYKALIKDILLAIGEESTNSSSSNSGTSNTEIQLPRTQLPCFTGKYEEWQAFHDMFVSLIHENDKLSLVQKLHYLKSSLSGEPESLLRNFATTEQNYHEAWKQLMKRYNNKRFNANAILKILFSQKQMTTESASAIKQLLDTTSSCIKALNNMQVDTGSWDAIIVYLIVSKLDVESHKQWENKLSLLPDDIPTWQQLVDFLESRFRGLEIIDASKHTSKAPAQNNHKQTSKTKSFHSSLQGEPKHTEASCAMCGGQHYLYHCKKFELQSVNDRQGLVHSKGLCFNCMSPSHVAFKCRQSTCCRKCGRRHHTMLHNDKDNATGTNTETRGHTQAHKNEHTSNLRTSETQTNVVANFSKGEIHSYNVLLATAVVWSHARNGTKYYIRALLDQGSQASFVTEATAQLLGLKRITVNGVVSGLGDGQTRIKHMVSLRVGSRHNSEITIQVNAYVLGSLTSLLPSDKLNSPDWLDLDELQLADPGYTEPGKIVILLGAEVYSEILSEGMIKNPQGNLLAQNTVLGWVISGRMIKDSTSVNVVSTHAKIREDEFLKQFWELEAEPNSIQKKQTKEEQRCEQLYEETTVRNEDGRFIVKLPFKNEDPQCQYGKSKEIAQRKLMSLEKRLMQNPKLYDDYRKVMNEYVSLNHMSLVAKAELDDPRAVYLPHHAVIRDDKETTRVRIVFNASSKGVNDVSLNDDLLVGPKIQQDLRHLLMRWRRHPICIIADLVKMYRQVLVSDQDTNFQRILWRPNPDVPIQHYKLLTLTFGTACAPYLAVKTLQKLAEVEKGRFPVASEITKNDYYIDDLMTGCDNLSEAKQIYGEMNVLMTSGGFQLQKWSSNSKDLLEYIGKDNLDVEQSVPIKTDNKLKVLGIRWNRDTDNFEYTVDLPELKSEFITKRQVLSDIARLYDPIGWIAPVVISAKIIIQKLWKARLDWDDQLTDELLNEWLQYREELNQIKNIMIPRWLHCTHDCNVELHAFSDASRVAFAAAVYIRVIDNQGHVHVMLVSAKTKVAPIDKEVSIRRLELCGAVLAAKLLSEISQVMNVPKEKLYAWTDSTVVLAWLKGGASRWTTFVSNRVSEILNILDYEHYRHVTTDMNPSDCASRGIRPAELKSHSLWWNGPPWLCQPDVETEEHDFPDTHEEERMITLTVTEKKEEDFEWSKFSNLSKMLRIMSRCRRILNLKKPKEERVHLPDFIQVEEIKESLQMCIKQVQELEFKEEIKQLHKGEYVSKKSMLHPLSPFLDHNGILRVGGRINEADVSYDKKHPIIMPVKSHLTQLLIQDAHEKTLHGGPQIMLNWLRSKYWILRAREQVKKYYRGCITCQRYAKASRTQFMGQLPDVRLKPSKPFKSTGVDYAGPINIKFSPGRGAKSYKGYICLFVCMVSRAVHIEAVTDLSTKAFLAAFRRFTSRRGHCQDLFSDNGTNFIGADRQLREMFDRAKSNMPDEIAQALTLESTTWHFIPPYAPNFGGLWEAGVRCAKAHLRKVIGDSTLTYEELSTVLSQIEACLNSRPLSILSDDPNDPLPLTPGHFLVGEAITNVTDEDCSNDKFTGLDRWKLVQKMVNDFWKKWSKEYLVNLSHRYKWSTKKPEPNIDDIVILRDDNVPPSKWILGKILAKHPGPDNVTRVVTIKCKNGIVKRPLSKVIALEK